MRRGDLWITEVGGKRRTVLVLTRAGVLHARNLITVAEITTSIRGLGAEVEFDHAEPGIGRPPVINCYSIHTIAQVTMSGPVGQASDETKRKVCSAIKYALGC